MLYICEDCGYEANLYPEEDDYELCPDCGGVMVEADD
jgi:DNA-directed RNA polymerase subunit RPC12/RpoP